MTNYRLLLAVSLTIAGLAYLGMLRLEIDTDLARTLPSKERVIADGLGIFQQHPIHDQIAIDITADDNSPNTLLDIAKLLEIKLKASGLFTQVGNQNTTERIPELALHVAEKLPLLFSQNELEEKVAPLLEENQVSGRIQKLYQELSTMEGIGQTNFISLDPLGLKDLILAKMAPLAPSLGTKFHKGGLFSADGKHLLLTAKPHAAGTNTASASEIALLLDKNFAEIAEKYSSKGVQVRFTPVGAYRAALDNELIIRHDVQLALILATLGISLLLLFAFPRPFIGLLSLVPALAGISLALFTYSLFHSSISIMVLGFGGAVISITVDHGIAYLLFLDRSHQTSGREASVEIRSIGIMAVISSIGAFLILSFSGFPVFTQLGQFTALGIFFSFLFVHSVFPRIFPTMPPGNSKKPILHRVVNKIYNLGWPGCISAIILVLALSFFAKPQFYTSLSSMNTVSQQTIDAEKLITEVWGDIGKKTFLMNSGNTISTIQQDNDQILEKVEKDLNSEFIDDAFVPSMIFPGTTRAEQNLAAWHTFWTIDRRDKLAKTLTKSGASLGFTEDAFSAFLALLYPAYNLHPPSISNTFYDLLGISERKAGPGLVQFITVIPGKNYNSRTFFNRYGENGKIFDATYFTDRLSQILFSTFITMLAIIAISVAILLLFFFLNLRLTILTLLPPLFAYICTLGTLNLLNQPIDIPALMLSIVIFGMGIDYSIFCVRAHQRYQQINHPSYNLVLVAVFMAGGSTLIGFGVLCLAEHSLLRSIGITSLLGIGYSLLGTFVLLPPLMNLFHNRKSIPSIPDKKDIKYRIRHRFKGLEAYPRMFARFKLQFDPMFRDLAKIVPQNKSVKTIVDIGCGYGVPACWFLEQFKTATIYGIDPDPERIRVATIACSDRGSFRRGWATDLPTFQNCDIILLLDMLHYLDDETAKEVFRKSFGILHKDGTLIARYVIFPSGKPSFSWKLENFRIKLSGRQAYYRTPEQMERLLENAGFAVDKNVVTSDNSELFFLRCQPVKEEGNGRLL